MFCSTLLSFLLNIYYLCFVMLLNTTYNNPEHKLIIEDLVGKPFSFRTKLRLGGSGSSRMIIDEVSPKLEKTLLNGADLNYANVELRPKGILIRISRRTDNFTWIIPYYQLYMYKSNGLSIHGQGQFLHFRNDRLLQRNSKFFDKVTALKVEAVKDHYYVN